MAQNFKEVGNAASVKDDLQTINDNFDSVASNFSGTSFPTANLAVGMQFYNTSNGNSYVLKGTSPVVWEQLVSVNTEINHMKVARVGGSYTTGGVSIIDQGKIDVAGACRTAFLPAAGIEVEYSIDGGKTYLDYGLTDEQKRGLCSMNRATTVALGKTAPQSLSKILRVTLSPVDRYANAEQFYCWFTTSGATCVVDIERSTVGAKDSFAVYRKDIPVSGWSGNNVINLDGAYFGGVTGQESQTYSYRFVFRIKEISSNADYVQTRIPYVTDLRIYGGNVWSHSNPKMFNDQMYAWDVYQNVTFPAKVSATEFVGKLNGGIEPMRIAAGTDLNTVLNSGLYRCDTNGNVATLINCPTGNAFSLFVSQTTNAGVHQALTEFLTSKSVTYYRNKYNEAWGAWYQNIDSNNIASQNVNSANKLTTARTINGTAFDGSKNISIGILEPLLIGDSTDLNSLTYPGMYSCQSNATAASLLNCPTPNAFSLIVERHAGHGQTLTEYMTTGARKFYRNFYGGSWGAWVHGSVFTVDGKMSFPNGTKFWIE